MLTCLARAAASNRLRFVADQLPNRAALPPGQRDYVPAEHFASRREDRGRELRAAQVERNDARVSHDLRDSTSIDSACRGSTAGRLAAPP